MKVRTIKQPVIVVDGPAGSGKSTVCKHFAEKTGYSYLDTGALYRTVAWLAAAAGVPLDDEARLAELCIGIEFLIPESKGKMIILADGKNVENVIRTENVGMSASKISKLTGVRKALLPIQREAGKEGGIIAEGRDMGTVVFPDAEIKIYLDADPGVRAGRRWLELRGRGEKPEYNDVFEDMVRRDAQDRSRDVAPLKPSDDAFIIDTTNMDIEAMVEAIVKIYHNRSSEIRESPYR
ncbi:MAG: (d)CMP kinase [Syntrophales bacterium]|nr:(d)CMP kinase [Syntrophales bacterium]